MYERLLVTYINNIYQSFHTAFTQLSYFQADIVWQFFLLFLKHVYKFRDNTLDSY